ncbi:hypothetical protein JCM3765_007346 [Sporobolomyces pararoseus]
MSDHYRGNYPGGGGGGYNYNQGGGGGGYNRFYPQNGYNGHTGPAMGPAGYQRKRQRDEDFPENHPGNNYRRRTDERGNYGSPRQQQQQSRGGGDQQQSFQSSQTKFKESIWKLGSSSQGEDYEPLTEIPLLAQQVEAWYFKDKPTVLLSFRAAISELPHKLHHYASLLAHLSLNPVNRPISLASRITPSAPGLPPKPISSIEGEQPEEEVEMMNKVNVGKEIVEDLMKAFQSFLDERKWKSVRYSVNLFSQLTMLPKESPLIASTSLLTLLSSFLSVLDEPGLRLSRGDECVRIIVESLLRIEGGDEGAYQAAGGLESLKEGISNYLELRKDLILKSGKESFADEETREQWVDNLQGLVNSLLNPSISGHQVSNIFNPPLLTSINDTTTSSGNEPLYLPMILVPPELEETDLSLISHGGGGGGNEKSLPQPPTSAGLRGDEGVGYEGTRLSLRLFEDDGEDQSVPSSEDKAGNVLRGLISDLINLYEVNRKEGAAILLDLPKWCKKGTFKDPKSPASDSNDEDDLDGNGGPGWSLENLIVESIFNSILCVPSPPHPLAYYHSLLTELCRLSPQTIAPSLGKSVRKLYSLLGNDSGKGGKIGSPVLDPSGIKRFSEWFSVHLSNFGFMWSWGDWSKEMEISDKHPKRVFVKRVLELETRLSYFDRVKGTVPDSMLETNVMMDDAPGPEYDYDSSDHTHAAAASSFLRLIRSKASVSEALEELTQFQKSLESEHGLNFEESDRLKRDLAVQVILNVGSRSFSHFLNALERYLVLLRNLTDNDKEKKQDLLETVSKFWRRNGQFHLIVIDKLLQYRLLEPSDVITWVFSPSPSQEEMEDRKRKTWADLDLWGMVAIVLRTLESRTLAGKGRLEGLKREEEVRQAENINDRDTTMVTADDNEGGDNNGTSNSEIESANSYLKELELDQTLVLVQIVQEFVKLLPENVDKDDWEVWWIEGWFREFCRIGLTPKVWSRNGGGLNEKLKELEIPEKSAVESILKANKLWSDYA